MLNPRAQAVVDLPPDTPPVLTVVIDTEEEFDWSAPFSSANVGTSHIRHQHRAQRIFEKYGITPTYLVDFPVAESEESRAVLREFVGGRHCEIGAHLHPWVNPPIEETVDARSSYPGNLPPSLERAKLMRLTDAISSAFGVRPVVYRAGRYGVGAASATMLEELGYEIDMSVVPYSDFRRDLGPDFGACGQRPYWFGQHRRLLELPLTVGWAGVLERAGKPLHDFVQSPLPRLFRAPGVLARLGLFERIRLSPEGITFDEMRRLTVALLRSGLRTFSLTYHSPSLLPGKTPYVRSASELDVFLDTLDRYFEFFVGELGGRTSTPMATRDLVLQASRFEPRLGVSSPATASSLAAGR
jgi:peptidoglycan/xylan/chitin deacetylase (PgdA/CDA1 family)